MKMIEYIYHRVKEDCARKEMKMEQNQEKRAKKKQKEYGQKILKLRSKELNSKLELKEGKGEVHVLQWKGETVSEYIGSGLIGSIFDKFRHNLFNLEQI